MNTTKWIVYTGLAILWIMEFKYILIPAFHIHMEAWRINRELRRHR